MKKTHIAFFIPAIYPCGTGGMEIYYNKLIGEMNQHADVLLFTACKQYNEKNMKVIRLNRRLLGIPGTARFYSLIDAFIKLTLNRSIIKIIHFPYTNNAGKWGYVLPALRVLFNMKYIIMIHDGSLDKWKTLSGNKVLFRFASRYIAVSNIIKTEYEKRTGCDFKLIYPLVPFNESRISKSDIRKKKGYSVKDKIILFVGSLKEIKAPDVLLSAYIQLGIDYITENNIKLLFVGDGIMFKQLYNIASSNNMLNYISFAGKVPNSEVHEYFKMADIYVIPSHFEGTSKSLLEAMFNKLPIIGSDVKGINNVITHSFTGLLFQKNNVNELQTAIKKYITDEKLGFSNAEQAYLLHQNRYSFNEAVSELINEYTSCN